VRSSRGVHPHLDVEADFLRDTGEIGRRAARDDRGSREAGLSARARIGGAPARQQHEQGKEQNAPGPGSCKHLQGVHGALCPV
ncbi:MAG: hypothetical protein AVDCRST_MAG89-4146, partial [uncultured Gemmatimonadetes bacterium]